VKSADGSRERTGDRQYAAILAADDWRPMSEYTADGRQIRLREGLCLHGSGPPRRRGTPRPAPTCLLVCAERPLRRWPDPLETDPGRRQSPRERERWLYGDQAGAYVRPPEPVYEPGDVTTRLTPVPLALLLAMRNGARLTERAWRWTVWQLHVPGKDPERLGERGINALRKVAFIARDRAAARQAAALVQLRQRRGWLLIAYINDCPEFKFLRYSSGEVTGTLAVLAVLVTPSRVTAPGNRRVT
jgi:hypothetical protein